MNITTEFKLKILLISSREDTKDFDSMLIANGVVPKAHNEYKPTMGYDLWEKNLVIDDVRVNLSLWYTSRKDRFEGLRSMIYSGSHGAIFAFDAENEYSWESIKKYIEYVINFREGVPCILIGHGAANMEAQAFAAEKGYHYVEMFSNNYSNALENTLVEFAQQIVEKLVNIENENRNKHKSSSDAFSHAS